MQLIPWLESSPRKPFTLMEDAVASNKRMRIMHEGLRLCEVEALMTDPSLALHQKRGIEGQ